MGPLNYQHLHYFWVAAREGSVSRASERLFLAQPTVSAQIRKLEQSLRQKLFDRVRRGLVLTDFGKTVFRYADEIFALGREIENTAKGGPTSRTPTLQVGVADVLPKLISYRLLKPALELAPAVRLTCVEGPTDRLLASLAVNELDIVLTDAPCHPSVRVLAYSHLLGECGASVVAGPALAGLYRPGFPRSLDGAPWLLPAEATHVRRSLDRWFKSEGVTPLVRAEFDDSALLKTFGQAGVGVFAVPTAIEDLVCRQYEVELVGRLGSVREQFYVVSAERRLKHPAVVAISDAAREKLFV
ncbi:MAG: LysR family transcriptional regulator [Gemmataceae bacterium]